jgi:hypothetical protein
VRYVDGSHRWGQWEAPGSSSRPISMSSDAGTEELTGGFGPCLLDGDDICVDVGQRR